MLKKYATSIGQKKYATNTSIDVNGAYPLSGNAPESRTDEVSSYLIQDLIPLDKDRFYAYFNAKKDWQKKNIDEKIDEYRNLLIDYTINRYHYTLGTNYLQLPLDEFKRKVNEVAVYGTGRKEYFTQVVEKIQPQFYILEDVKGSNITGKVSLVRPYYEINKLIKLKDSEELLVAMYGDIDLTDTNLVDITPVDIGSLKAFIKGNEEYHYQNDKVKHYNDEANQVLLIAELTGGVFPQIIKESNYGRRYYTGQSLQTMSSIVRGAALGDHYQYDLNAAVYAIKFFLCTHITDKKFTYTGEYIEGGAKYKDSIRKQIADYVFTPDYAPKEWQVSAVKNVITAVGFGATLNSKGYFDENGRWNNTAIADVFTYKSNTTNRMVLAKDKYEKLKTHPWLSEFIKEQTLMTDLITKWYIDNEMINKTDHNFLVDGRNAFNKNKVMAYIFQTFERGIMDKTEEFIKNEGNTVLLRVHDAIYTKKRVDMAELHMMLATQFEPGPGNYLGCKLFSFSQQECNRFEYLILEDIEHKEFIKQEEELARNYKSTLIYN